MVLLPGGGNWKLMLIFMQCQNVYSVNTQKMFTIVRSPLYFDDFGDFM